MNKTKLYFLLCGVSIFMISCNGGGSQGLANNSKSHSLQTGGLSIRDATLLGDPATVDSKMPVFGAHHSCLDKTKFNYILSTPSEGASGNSSYFINIDNSNKFNSLLATVNTSGGVGLFKASLDLAYYQDAAATNNSIQIVSLDEVTRTLKMTPAAGVKDTQILDKDYSEMLVSSNLNPTQFAYDCDQGYVSSIDLGYIIRSTITLTFNNQTDKNKFALGLNLSYGNNFDLKSRLDTFMTKEHTSVTMAGTINVYGDANIPSVNPEGCNEQNINTCIASMTSSVDTLKKDINSRLDNIRSNVTMHSRDYDQVMQDVAPLYGVGKVGFTKFTFNEIPAIMEVPKTLRALQDKISQAYNKLYWLPQILSLTRLQIITDATLAKSIETDTTYLNTVLTPYFQDNQAALTLVCFGWNETKCTTTVNSTSFHDYIPKVEELYEKYKPYMATYGYYSNNNAAKKEIFFIPHLDNKTGLELYPILLNTAYEGRSAIIGGSTYDVYSDIFTPPKRYNNPTMISSVVIESSGKLSIYTTQGEVNHGTCTSNSDTYNCSLASDSKFNPTLFSNITKTSDALDQALGYTTDLGLQSALVDSYPESSINNTLRTSASGYAANTLCNSTNEQCLSISDKGIYSGTLSSRSLLVDWISDLVVKSIDKPELSITKQKFSSSPLILYHLILRSGSQEIILATIPSHSDLMFRVNKYGNLIGVPYSVAKECYNRNKTAYNKELDAYIEKQTSGVIKIDFNNIKSAQTAQNNFQISKGVIYFNTSKPTNVASVDKVFDTRSSQINVQTPSVGITAQNSLINYENYSSVNYTDIYVRNIYNIQNKNSLAGLIVGDAFFEGSDVTGKDTEMIKPILMNSPVTFHNLPVTALFNSTNDNNKPIRSYSFYLNSNPGGFEVRLDSAGTSASYSTYLNHLSYGTGTQSAENPEMVFSGWYGYSPTNLSQTLNTAIIVHIYDN